ncbi:hypothetical protein [Sphingomonas sp.]|uniref:hypothetical protein n=1 Tax=Sphingomonas sp. TaxID=28214 RepID=UPI0031D785F8
MADPIARMVALAECELLVTNDPSFTDYLPQLDKSINEELAKLGFRDVQSTREALRLSVARIVKARKLAEHQLEQLAYAEQYALGNC